MSKNKLVDVIKNLSNHSQNRLLKFVHSPYHNTHRLVIKLAEYIVQCPLFKMEEAFHQLYSELSFDPQKLRNIMSYLQKLVDKFLLYEALEANPVEQSIQLLSIYRKDKQHKAFNSVRLQLEKQLKKSTIQNATLLFQRFQTHIQDCVYEIEDNRLMPKSVQKIVDTLDAYYLADRIKYSVLAKSHEALASKAYDLGFIEDILTYISTSPKDWLKYPAIQVYYLGYMVLVNLEAPKYFYEFKAALKEHIELFDHKEKADLNILAINYCIRKINSGNEAFIKEAFDIYKLGLENDLFMENGIFS